MTLYHIEGTAAAGECPRESAFDAHHPPSADLISQCVHCGFCLPACPTYLLWGNEMDSPRGRIYLMKMANTGQAAVSPEWVEHFDTCLGCMSCVTACPSGVQYDALIESTRAQIERLHPRSIGDRLFRGMIFNLFPKMGRLRVLRRLMAVYQRLGIQAAVRGSGLLKLLPARLRAMEALLPEFEKYQVIPETTPAVGVERRRVGLVLGCVQREFLSSVNAATVRVLSEEGCAVVAPEAQPCCGALLVHAGEEQRAEELARKMIDAFETAEVDVIISNAGGCGSSLKEYHGLLRDDPAYAARAARFSAKCRDVMEFLEELGPRAKRHSLPLRVAYQDSCHLQHAQRVCTQPRSQLASIPDLQLLELPEAAICCGSAGIYNLVQPETADTLARRKAEHIAGVKPEIVATGNPGCLLQLKAALDRSGQKVRVVHTIQLLDASIQDKKSF